MQPDEVVSIPDAVTSLFALVGILCVLASIVAWVYRPKWSYVVPTRSGWYWICDDDQGCIYARHVDVSNDWLAAVAGCHTGRFRYMPMESRPKLPKRQRP